MDMASNQDQQSNPLPPPPLNSPAHDQIMEISTALQTLQSIVPDYLIPDFPALLQVLPVDMVENLANQLAAIVQSGHRARPPHSRENVARFINFLPEIPKAELEEGSECAICRGIYGQNVSMDDGKPEGPVKLPCGHVFGRLCLQVLLNPKANGGWEHRICPLCRREIEGIGNVEVVGGHNEDGGAEGENGATVGGEQVS